MNVVNVKSHLGPYIPNWMKYGLQYRQAIRDIYKFHNLGEREKKSYIQKKVLRTVCEAYDNTMFYNGLYKRNDINPHKFRTLSDLNYLPIISKKDIIDHIDDLIVNNANKESLRRANTGGSTGNPLPLYRSKYEMVQEFAYLDYHLARLFGKYSWLNRKRVILRGNTFKGDVVTRFGCNLIISSQLINKSNINLVISKIKSFNPSLIHAYPSSLMKFIDLLSLSGETLKIPYMLTSSEVITKRQISLASNILNSQYLDLYGNSEHSILALNIKGQYDFDMSYGYPEFVEGKIISTKLLESPMPLIRYDCGDTYLDSSVLTDNINCKSLASIGGRVIEYIHDSSNNKLPVVSLIYGQHYRFFDAVSDFSLVQDQRGFLTVEYVAEKPLNPIDVNDAQEIVRKITKDKLDISFVKVDSMRTFPNGKKAFLVKGNCFER